VNGHDFGPRLKKLVDEHIRDNRAFAEEEVRERICFFCWRWPDTVTAIPTGVTSLDL
jgi:hypothetical protein